MRKNWLLITLAVFFVGACNGKTLVFSDVHSEARDDEPYFESMRDHTRDLRLVENFELIYLAHATLFSQSFSSEFERRRVRYFDKTSETMESIGKKAVFLVSIYGPYDVDTDLRDRKLWNLQLKSDAGVFKPSAVKKIRNKVWWRKFFPHISNWSEEYLIIFDYDLPNSTKNKELLGLSFTFSDINARNEMKW